jgi:hypothetical protein
MSELPMEIKSESFVLWTLNGKRNFSGRMTFFPVDRSGLIGVRQHVKLSDSSENDGTH